MIEEFKRCIHSDIRSFINEQKGETLDAAARLADDYSLTHKVCFEHKPNQSFTSKQRNSSFSPGNKRFSGLSRNPLKESFYKPTNPSFFKSTFNNSHTKTPTSKTVQQQTPSNTQQNTPVKPFNPVVCSYCKKPSQLLSDCWKIKRKESGQNKSKPISFVRSKFVNNVPDTFSDVRSMSDSSKVCVESPSDPIMEIFEPFVHDGFVSLESDLNNATPVKILRDTGCSQSLLLADTLPFSDKSYSGTNVLIKGVDSLRYSSVLLHNVYLSSNLVSGPVVLGIKPSLPFEGIHLLLRNDLAGDKVAGGPLLTNRPFVFKLLILLSRGFLVCILLVLLLEL